MIIIVSITDAKTYLRVDTHDDDNLISALIDSAVEMCADVARMDVEAFRASEDERARIAVLFATANAYEHREDFDPHGLKLQLRGILGDKREVHF